MTKIYVIISLIAALVIGGLTWRISVLDSDVTKYKNESADNAKRALTCNNNDLKTEQAYNVLDTNLNTLDASYNALDLVRQPVCVAVSAAPKPKHAKAASTDQPTRPDAISSGDLLALAREGEGYRLQLISCQSYAKGVAGIK